MSDAGDINLGWETLKSIVAKFIQAALGFAGVVVFTRLVGKAEFGGFYLLLSLVMIADRPIQGLGSAVNKRWSEKGAPRSRIVSTVLIVNAILVLVVGFTVFILQESVVAYTNLPGAPLLFVVLFGSIGLFTVFQGALSAEGYPARSTWIDTLRSVLTLPLQIVLVLSGLGALGMGYGLAGATLLVLPITLFITYRRPELPTRENLESLWEYAKFSIPGSFVGKAYDRMDVILLGFLIGTTSVANYEVALKLTVPAGFMSIAIGSALMPKISNNISRGRDFIPDVKNSISYISILAIPIFFGALAIPEHLVVTAFGGQYRDAALFLVGLAFYRIFATQTTVYRRTLGGMDLPNVNLRIGTYTLAFNIFVGIGLAYLIGPLGIVIATILAEMLQYGLSLFAVRKRTSGLNPVPRPVIHQLIAGLVMFLGVTTVERYLFVTSFFEVGILVGVGGLVYGIVLIVISPGIRITARAIYSDAIASFE